MRLFYTSVALAALCASAATAVTPSYAAPIFSQEPTAVQQDSRILEQANDHYRRRWHRHGHRHRNRVDAGDVLTGIGILAGVAIIADAASNGDRRNREDRYPQERTSNDRSRDDYQDSSLEGAISVCSNAAQRSASDARVDEITSARRDGAAWLVSGKLSDARGFDCGARDGAVDFIQIN